MDLKFTLCTMPLLCRKATEDIVVDIIIAASRSVNLPWSQILLKSSPPEALFFKVWCV